MVDVSAWLTGQTIVYGLQTFPSLSSKSHLLSNMLCVVHFGSLALFGTQPTGPPFRLALKPTLKLLQPSGAGSKHTASEKAQAKSESTVVTKMEPTIQSFWLDGDDSDAPKQLEHGRQGNHIVTQFVCSKHPRHHAPIFLHAYACTMIAQVRVSSIL